MYIIIPSLYRPSYEEQIGDIDRNSDIDMGANTKEGRI